MIALFIETLLITGLLSLCISMFRPLDNKKLLSCLRLSVVLMSGLAIYILHAFITSNYMINYVFEHSDSSLPWYFKIAAFWSGQEGSTLLFFLSAQLSLLVCLYLVPTRWLNHLNRTPYLFKLILLNIVLMDFYCLSGDLLTLNLPFIPQGGRDLNPLLKDYAMTYHPPLLLAGQAGFFSISLLSLLSHSKIKGSTTYLKVVSYTFIAILTLGITFGSLWAYHVLGWGGYWFWDPVENISLIPWLLGLALTHSPAYYDKYFIFIWPIILLGMLIVRSDSLISVHSFAQNLSNQWVLLLLFVSNILFSIVLLKRQPVTEPSHRQSSYLKSLGSFCLLALAFIIVGALVLPILYSYFSEYSSHLGPDFYSKSLPPLLIAGLCYTIVAKALPKMAIAFSLFYLYLFTSVQINLLSSLSILVLIIISIVYKTWRKSSLIPHLLVLTFIMTVSLNTQYSYHKEVLLEIGQTHLDSHFTISSQIPYQESGDHHTQKIIYPMNFVFQDYLGNNKKVSIYPFQEIHPIQNMWTSKMYCLPGILDEYCFMLGEKTTENNIYITIHFNPLVRIIWALGIALSIYLAYVVLQHIGSYRKIVYNTLTVDHRNCHANEDSNPA